LGDVRLDLHLPDAPQCSTVFSGQVPQVRMALVPESARFALLRTSNPVHLVVMPLIMLAVISTVMMIKL
jgi:hypothetical protein